METLTITNGGRYYNEDSARCSCSTPSMPGALTWWNDLVHPAQGPPARRHARSAISASSVFGNAAMMMLSTGSLTYAATQNSPTRSPSSRATFRNAVPIGGASLINPPGESDEREAAWKLVKWLTTPEKTGKWSRATGYSRRTRLPKDP